MVLPGLELANNGSVKPSMKYTRAVVLIPEPVAYTCLFVTMALSATYFHAVAL